VKSTLGLRTQIVLALLLLMLLAFVPLFYAVANVTRATLHGAHDATAIVEPLVRLLALYMGLFAVALLTFAYFVLTRLIVRPVEALSNAAERVATGARVLKVPSAGAQELVRLGESVQAMATRLMAEEEAMRNKVNELTHTRAQLIRSERMASVGRLAAGVAHEIGNPIAALMGMQDLLIDGVDAETHHDFLVRMRKETERIHTVVRDLLDFARPEEPGDGAALTTPADVASVVDDVFALVRPQKEYRNVTLTQELEPGLTVHFAASRFTQVLLNLLLNAGAALATKGSGRVVVRARKAEGDVRIEVEDDGPGISAELGDRVFEPFVTTKDIGHGTGLGLAVCRGLVESAGGSISVDSSYTAGARLVILLPMPTKEGPALSS
jgi:two-component system NtrC family sensor kinase